MFFVLKMKKILFITTAILVSVIFMISSAHLNGETPENTAYVPIVMYHRILSDTKRSGKHTITPDELEKDLIYLKENNYTTVVMADLINFVYESTPLPEKPIVLTFDDGHFNNYYYANALLKKYNMKAVLSVVGVYSDKSTDDNEENPNYSYITWDRMKEIVDEGIFEIQNHTYNLHVDNHKVQGSLRKKNETMADYKERFTKDINKLQDKIYKETNYKPTTFTYPFGFITESSTEILKEAGFYASLSCKAGISCIKTGQPDSLFLLERNNRPSGIATNAFFSKTTLPSKPEIK